MYSNLCTNLPGAFMAFSDHPFPLREKMFPTHEQVLRYLGSYAERFELAPLIQFRTEVVGAEWDSSSRTWAVETRNAAGAFARQSFSRLAVCTGHFNAPMRPELPGSDEFPGSIIHSYDFVDAQAYAGKSVLIVGSNVSAGDIAAMVARSTPGCTVHLSARSPPTLIGRANCRPALKLGAQLHGGVVRLTADGTVVLSAPDSAWGVPPRTASAEVRVDAVICATGYAYAFPFLRRTGLEEELCGDGTSMRHLYRRVLYTRNPSLALIGTPNTLIPPWIVFQEQARWLAAAWGGRVQLPSEADMELEASGRHARQPAQHDARDHLGLKTPAYCNDLAALSGSEGYYTTLLRSKVWRMLASKVLGPAHVPEPQRAML